MFSPLTMASYVFTRPTTSSDLHRQDLLQGMGRAVSLQRPNLHFAKTLAAELRFAAEGLLGHERVGAGGTRMNLIVYQVDAALRYTYSRPSRGFQTARRCGRRTMRPFYRPAESPLCAEQLLDIFLGRAVEYRRRHLPAERACRHSRDEPPAPARCSYGKERPRGSGQYPADVPSGRNGMSSTGRMREITPLLPCRPAILSPTEIFRFCAM